LWKSALARPPPVLTLYVFIWPAEFIDMNDLRLAILITHELRFDDSVVAADL
jgi:hypothetical protein